MPAGDRCLVGACDGRIAPASPGTGCASPLRRPRRGDSGPSGYFQGEVVLTATGALSVALPDCVFGPETRVEIR